MGIVRLPATAARCPGYVINHIEPGITGGATEPWQIGQEAKANDWRGDVARARVASPQPDSLPGRQDRGTFSA